MLKYWIKYWKWGFMIVMLFCKVMLSNYLHQISLAYRWVFLFLSCRVILAEYILVLRVLSHHVTDEVLSLLKVVTKCWWAQQLRIYFSSTCFCWRMSFKLAIYFNLWYCKHFKAMFSLIRFELSMYYLFVNSIVILFLLQTLCIY